MSLIFHQSSFTYIFSHMCRIANNQIKNNSEIFCKVIILQIKFPLETNLFKKSDFLKCPFQVLKYTKAKNTYYYYYNILYNCPFDLKQKNPLECFSVLPVRVLHQSRAANMVALQDPSHGTSAHMLLAYRAAARTTARQRTRKEPPSRKISQSGNQRNGWEGREWDSESEIVR